MGEVMDTIHESPTMTPTGRTRDWLVPTVLVVLFTALITGWFNLSQVMPLPLAVLAGAAWGVLLSWAASRLSRHPTMGAWLEDVFVSLGTVGFAFAGCGGLMAILLLDGALDSSSVTGETLESTFLPAIPYYIIVNSILEILIIPGVIAVSWRPGPRRVLILAGAALYFAMRVWTYLAFVPARLSWADEDHAAQVLTAVERRQAVQDLMLNDPRWALLLVMMAIFLVAAHLSRVREQKLLSVAAVRFT
jgi:hypothetical protein